MASRSLDFRGTSVPRFFYGTAWKEDRTSELTTHALNAGFRAIDTANQRRHYVEAAVGDAASGWLETTGARREELFLQTKFTYARGQDHRLPYDPDAGFAAQVAQSFESTLEHLRTTYLDSYLLHGPASGRRLTDADWTVWRAMEGLARAGKARFIGVSNVTLEQLELLVGEAEVPPAFVQNRCYAQSGWDRAIRAYCREQSIVYQGFSLLTANARELRAPAVERVVRRTGRTLPQVVFRFAMDLGMIPLTGTSSPLHMQQDLSYDDFELLPEELAAIEHVVQ